MEITDIIYLLAVLIFSLLLYSQGKYYKAIIDSYKKTIDYQFKLMQFMLENRELKKTELLKNENE